MEKTKPATRGYINCFWRQTMSDHDYLDLSCGLVAVAGFVAVLDGT